MITLKKKNATQATCRSLQEWMNDEVFDMLEAFNDNEIAVTAIILAKRLNGKNEALCSIYDHKGKRYTIKVNNRLRGFVSMSDENETALSETHYYPYFTEHDPKTGDSDLEGLKNLCSMINEAWYLLTDTTPINDFDPLRD